MHNSTYGLTLRHIHHIIINIYKQILIKLFNFENHIYLKFHIIFLIYFIQKVMEFKEFELSKIYILSYALKYVVILYFT